MDSKNKERIIEFLAVQKNTKMRGPIILLGLLVGKTSLGKSIAKLLIGSL